MAGSNDLNSLETARAAATAAADIAAAALAAAQATMVGARELDTAASLQRQLREKTALEVKQSQSLPNSRQVDQDLLAMVGQFDSSGGSTPQGEPSLRKGLMRRNARAKIEAELEARDESPFNVDMGPGRGPYPSSTESARRVKKEPTRDQISAAIEAQNEINLIKDDKNDRIARPPNGLRELPPPDRGLSLDDFNPETQRWKGAAEEKHYFSTFNNSRFKIDGSIDEDEATGQDLDFTDKPKSKRPMTAGEAASYKPESQADKKKRTAEQRRQEQDQKRASREREEMDRLRWASLENITDEALNTASEKPISEGGGAASGSNMGAFAKRLKGAGGRLYNAVKGNRFGRRQFQKPRFGPGSGKGKSGTGATSRAGVPKGVGGGKPPIPPVGAAGAAGAAGAGGAGGAGVAGATGAGGAGAGALAAAGPVGIVIALGVAAAEATKAVYAFARAQEETVRKLAQYGGQQAVAIAKLDVERQFRDIKTAQQTGSSSSDLTESISQFENKLQPIESLLTNIANTVGARMMDILTGMLEAVEPIVEILTEIMKALGGDDTKVPKTPWDDIDRLQKQQEAANAPKWPQRPFAGN